MPAFAKNLVILALSSLLVAGALLGLSRVGAERRSEGKAVASVQGSKAPSAGKRIALPRAVVTIPPPPLVPPSLASPGLLALEEENTRLRSINQVLQKQLRDILNWILANFRGKYPVAEKHMADLHLQVLDEQYQLHPDIAQFLNITADEQALINDVLSYARLTVKELQQERMIFSNPHPERTVIQIPEFAEEGEALRNDIETAITATLGESRSDRFTKVARESMETSLGYFGNGSRTMVFDLIYSEEGDVPRLMINDSWILPDGESSWQIMAWETHVDKLPEKYRDYAEFLPEGFSPEDTP